MTDNRLEEPTMKICDDAIRGLRYALPASAFSWLLIFLAFRELV